MYVGRLEANKRVDWLLRVLASLRPYRPDLVLHLVGDGPLRAQLEATCRAQRLEQQVVFEGALPPSEVAAALRRADLFVLPSAYESFGTAALEAMAAGLPVVASDLPALHEATGGHAILLPPDDLDGWVGAILDLLADPGQRATLAAEGRGWAAAFTWDAILDRFEPFVFEAAGARATR